MNKLIYAAVLSVSMGFVGSHSAAAATTRTLTLQWLASTQTVAGYEVYYGRTNAQDRMRRLPVPVQMNLSSPAVQYNVLRDLGALPGQKVCFRVRAYNNTAKSGFSNPVCATV